MKLWEFISKALSESADEPSAMRVNSFYLVILFVTVLAFGFVWVVMSKMESLIIAYASILVTSIGSALYFKNKQKDKESDSNGTTA